jgi:restriction endonuclease S subunit
MNFRKDKWQRRKLKEVMSFKNGFNFNKGNLENGWKVLGVSDFQDYFYPKYQNLETLISDKLPSSDYLIEDNDILFVRSNGNKDLVGRTLLIKDPPFPITFSAFCIRGRFHNSILDSLFFTFYSKSDLFKQSMKNLVQGTNITNVSQGLLSEIEVPIPPIEEQIQLSSLFQSIETAIEQAAGQERNLKRLRKSLINSLSKEEPVFGNLINQSNKKEYSIDDLVDEVTARTDNPSKSGFEKFIGLEDFESGELSIQNYASTEKLVSTMRLCKKNDILFARRNAYLKRVSQAEIDCVCSGDVIVLRANEKIIQPMFLILVMNTNEFWDFAISNAAGTMSKRVKYRDLATYKFELPDLKTQEKILEIFKHLETTISQLRQQKSTLKNLKHKLLNEILG